jgi:hypothetical protein
MRLPTRLRSWAVSPRAVRGWSAGLTCGAGLTLRGRARSVLWSATRAALFRHVRNRQALSSARRAWHPNPGFPRPASCAAGAGPAPVPGVPCEQAHVSAEQPPPREDARVPAADADPCRAGNPGRAASQGARPGQCLTRVPAQRGGDHRCYPRRRVCGAARSSRGRSATAAGRDGRCCLAICWSRAPLPVPGSRPGSGLWSAARWEALSCVTRCGVGCVIWPAGTCSRFLKVACWWCVPIPGPLPHARRISPPNSTW